MRLAKANWTDGLRQVDPERGRATKAAKVGGFECRCLKTPEKEEGFLYFIIDPTFKATNAQEVKVVVQYFDATEGSFTMDYDGQAGKHTQAESIVHLRASAQWETAEFILRNTRFDNLQDNNADFRLRIKVPEFFVRRVEVLRDTTPTITDKAGPDSVTVLLQEPPVQQGLRLGQDPDGKSTPAVIGGQACRRMDKTYMYFVIDPVFKWAPHMRVRVDVEVFDASTGLLEIQYDSWLDEGNSQGAYRRAPRAVLLRQTKQWRMESFVLPESRFENRQNGRSDFRLRLSKPEAYVRRVTVSRDASPDAPTPPGQAASMTRGASKSNSLSVYDLELAKASVAPAYALKRAGQWAASIPAFEAALREYPAHADSYHGLAQAQRELGYFDAALRNHDRAIQLDPGRRDLYWDRGETYLRMKKYDAAIADFETCVAENRGFGRGYRSLGQAYRGKGDFQRALIHHAKSIELEPEEASFYRERGNTYRQMGQRELADADFAKEREVRRAVNHSHASPR